MEQSTVERRRHPRVEAANGAIVMRPVSMAVQMLDLSSEGLLLACPHPLSQGARLHLTARVAGQRLDASVQVRHASTQWDQAVKGYRVGGCFVSLDPMARCVIDELLSGA